MNDLKTISNLAVDAYNLERIRNDFPILNREIKGKKLVYLDNGASSQKPIQVIKAIEDYYKLHHSNVHRGAHTLSQEATEAYEAARKKVWHFLNAEEENEIIFTKGTTDGINLVAHSFGHAFLKEGDEIIISEMEHHSNIVPWQLICQLKGAHIKVIPVLNDGTLDMNAFDSLLSDRTKLVAIAHISNSLGTINPVETIIQKAHEKDIPVLLDGAQAVPHQKIDVQALDVDFYAFSGHKMFAPTGIGILYGKRKWLDKMVPYQGGGDMIEHVTFDKTTYNELPFKFEAGTPNMAGAIGLGAAIDYLDNIGYESISDHEKTLLDYATQEIEKIEGIQIIGTSERKASVISMHIKNAHPYDVGTLLDHLGIAVRTGHHCTQPLMERFGIPGTIRASFALYNTLEEVDTLVAGLKRAIQMLR